MGCDYAIGSPFASHKSWYEIRISLRAECSANQLILTLQYMPPMAAGKPTKSHLRLWLQYNDDFLVICNPSHWTSIDPKCSVPPYHRHSNSKQLHALNPCQFKLKVSRTTPPAACPLTCLSIIYILVLLYTNLFKTLYLHLKNFLVYIHDLIPKWNTEQHWGHIC
jgi:hypothetical protein